MLHNVFFLSFSVGHNLMLNFIKFHTAGALFAYAISGTKSIGCVLDNIIGSHYILLSFVLNVLCFLTVRFAIIPFVVNLCISRVPVVISRLGNNVTIVRIILILNYYP